MKKRLFTIICAVFVCVILCIAVSADNIASGDFGADGGSLSWAVDGSGTLIIEGEGEMGSFSDSEPAPWHMYAADIVGAVIGEGVTGIGDYAFFGCSELVSVEIPGSVSKIGAYAFLECSSLTSVEIPRSVAEIGGFAFGWCTSLEKAVIQSWDTEFGESVFFMVSENFMLHSYEGSTAEDYAYANSHPFEKIFGYSGTCGAEGDNLTWFIDDTGTLVIEGEGEIRDFSNAEPAPWNELNSASDIVSIAIEDGVTGIGDYAFLGCSELVSISVPRGLIRIGDCAFRDCISLTSALIPRTVTEIGDRAFDWCTSLEKVVIQSWDTEFGEGVFDTAGSDLIIYGYKGSTTEAYAADSERAFAELDGYRGECGDTLTWTLYDDGELVIEGDGEMDDWTNSAGAPWFKKLRNNIVRVVIGEGVTNIGDYAFNGCGSLTEIYIPDGVTVIGDSAFCNCDVLTSVWIPENVSEIGDSAFLGCVSLADVTFPEVLMSIGTLAFADCVGFMSIVIPENVVKIGDYAFEYCENLSKVTVYSRDAVFGEDVFSETHAGLAIHAYKGSTAEKYANSEKHTFIALYEPIIYGDATGDGVTGTGDALELARYIAGWKGYNADTVNITVLDLNSDTKVNSIDLIILARHLAEWDGYETLPFSAA